MNPSAALPNPSNLAFVEELLEAYHQNPSSVPAEWQSYFAAMPAAANGAGRVCGPSFTPRSIFNPAGVGIAQSNGAPNGAPNGHAAVAPAAKAAVEPPRPAPVNGPPTGAMLHAAPASLAGALSTNPSTHTPLEAAILQDRVDQMVRSYRVRGHMIAHIDPLGLPRPFSAELDPRHFGFSDADLERPVSSRTICGPSVRTVGELLERLWNTYCRFIGVQFMHIDSLECREWLQNRMEGSENRIELSRSHQLRILNHLTKAVVFEEFIQKKFLGAKSFSLEGAESLIPLLDLALEKAGEQGVDQVVIGMAHRGRLNVLANILGKSPRQIFREFEDKDAERNVGRGDVKYHMGYHNEWVCANGQKMHLSLCFNPSHLEYVNPVALGRLRAKLDRENDPAGDRGLCVLIHGDAAFAGEGIVQETLNLSELEGYRTGGALHIIVNNQVGFTTDPHDARSCPYATDVAKMLQSPIFHVNGENPEAVAQVVDLALEFRKQFKRDVIIDMYCYRRRGHNETDEPSFTQPLMYQAIKERKGVREGYLDHLLQLGEVTAVEAEQIAKSRREMLEKELSAVNQPAEPNRRRTKVAELWRNYRGGPDDAVPEVETGVPKAKLQELLAAISTVPAGFTPHPTIKRLLDDRAKMARGEKPLDWAAAELLALATLSLEGYRVRMSGQDAQRGTFSHRHAVLHDASDGRKHFSLQGLHARQMPVEIFNSPLSEAGVLGFEYGYGIAFPDALVLWEAQFGDFVNCAQVIIDQFISSAEYKWESLNGVVMLLPHGFEGQGPEHSSARVERFLQLCAEDNIQVCNPSTPANYFHLLRRQVLRPYRKPLVVFTPKKLLRLPEATSTFDDLASGRFQRSIPDLRKSDKKPRRVLLTSGKIYYELIEQRTKLKADDVMVARLEQYYPLRDEHFENVLANIPAGTPVFWVQEEPENMGAWRGLMVRFGRSKLLGRYPFEVISRPATASTATGSGGAHKLEQQDILNRAFSA